MLPAYIAELDFDEFLELQSSVTRITEKTFAWFVDLFSKEDDRDSYTVSPAYYAFTGRRGLWVFEYEDTFVPFCWHPNIDGQILVFPPRGAKSFTAIEELISTIPAPPAGFTLARFKPEDVSGVRLYEEARQEMLFATKNELVLDWQYPVHILSTHRTAEATGHNYMLIRNRLRQIKKQSVQIEPLSPAHIPTIKELASRWATLQADDASALIDLTDPYAQILRLFEQGLLNLNGLVFTVNGNVEAVTLWDVSRTQSPTANIYMNLCNVSIKGLSEFSIKSTAEKLLSQNIAFMNLGGSETSGLNRYKKKFVPAYSIDLYSMEPITKTALYPLIRIHQAEETQVA